MKQEEIEKGAWSYIATVAGSDPNCDPSQFEPDYNGFIAGAHFVINGDHPVSKVVNAIFFALELKEAGKHTQSEQQAANAIRMINGLI